MTAPRTRAARRALVASLAVLGTALQGLTVPALADQERSALGKIHVAAPTPSKLRDFAPEHGQGAARQAQDAWSRAQANGKHSLAEQATANQTTSLTATDTTATKTSGDYSATPLAPSSSWSAGGSSGSFSWSYPISLPPAAAGPVPDLSLNYDSGSIDGRLPSTNNQPSDVGEGFDLTQSYVERTYGSCDDDGHDQKFDRCWQGDQVSLMLNGQSNRLVKVDDSTYRLEHDDASTVELLTGNTANGDDNGEYWKVTTGDGTQFFFGKDKLPGAADDAPTTDSVWTVPVFGDDTGEPCHDSTFESSSCRQAWRWNLDYVVDLHGNASTYWYAAEHNNYARNGDASPGADYVRGGYLKRIDYGLRANNLFDDDSSGSATVVHQAPERVVLSVGERCLQSGTGCDSLTKDTKDNWPDVPFDSICKDGDACTGNVSPSFFTRKLLTKITTQVADGSSYDDVDAWDFDHLFLDAGEVGDTSDQTLWLSSITHTGLAGGGTAIAMDPVRFTPTMLENRVDGGSDDILPLGKPRIYTITSETGGITTVTYSAPDCWAGNSQVPARLPASADSNKMRCFPSYWSPYGATPQKDWFQKYVVTDVSQSDPGGGAPDVVTRYVYGDGDGSSDDGAWHFNAQPMTPKREQTWSEWRGYAKVTTLVGDPGREPVRSKTVDVFLRGMDGDKNDDGTVKNVSVAGIDAPAIADSDQYAGFNREHVQYDGLNEDGTTGPEIGGTVNDPWSTSKASQTFPGDTIDGKTYPAVTVKSWMVRTEGTTTRTRVTSGTPTDRLVVRTSAFDGYGMPTQVDSYAVADAAQPSVRTDARCTRTWYARNPALGLTSLVSRTQTVAVACSATPSLPTSSATAGDVISDSATLYDSTSWSGANAWDNQSPTVGEPQYAARPTAYASGAPSAWQKVGSTTYDALGRPVDAYDAKDDKSSTAYTPAGAGVPVSRAVTNALLQNPTVTTLEPAHGQPVKVTDTNGKVTEIAYDALGRTTSVWTPVTSRSLGAPPATKYAYHLGRRAADGTTDESWVSTGTLVGNSDTYTTSYQFYDSLLRPVQTQTPSPAGGRVIAETSYDSRGLKASSYADIYDPDSAPDGERQGVVYGRAPSQTETTFDGAGRPVLARLLVGGVERSRTSTSYTGDSVAVTPPAGGTATRELVDPLGRVSERRQYNGTSPTGSGYTKTTFGYLKTGQLGTVTAPDATSWTYGYDLFGRQTKSTDPDKGTSTSTYNVLDQVDSATDARGSVLLYDYDKLNRKTVEYAGSRTAANKQAEWAYDAVAGAVGYPSSSTRYVGGAAYTRKITAYDAMYHPKTTQVVLPSTDPLVSSGAVTATTSMSVAFNRDGTQQSTTEPAVAGLPSETIATTYDSVGLPLSSKGTTSYVLDTTYDSIGQPLQLSMGVASTGTNKAYLTNTFEAGTHRTLRSSITDTLHPWMAQDLNYSYDDAGNVTAVADPTTLGGTGQADFQCFTNDGYGRLTEAWTPKTNDCAATGRTTGNLGGAAPYWTSFTYTTASQRDTQTAHASAGSTVTRYGYGTATCTGSVKRPHTLSTVATTPPGAATVTATYGCDQAGDTTSRPGVQAQQTLTWNAENRLSRATEPAVGTKAARDTTYVYDADGTLLIRRPTNDVGESVLFLGATEVHSTKSSPTATPVVKGQRYYAFGTRAVALRTATKGVSGSTLVFLFGDTHGTSTVALNSATLAITKRYLSPFGGSRSGTWVDDKGFLGKSADVGTGLTHVGAREYDPGTGSFLSADPVLDTTDGISLNGYAYADSNPLTKSDPTGQMLPAGEGGGAPTPSTPHHTSHTATTAGSAVISSPAAPAANPYPWWLVWNPRHDTAVNMRASALQVQAVLMPGMGRVTTSRKENIIAGGSSVNPGDENGYADLILWGKDTVYVWEIKHAGDAAERAGQGQVNNYVAHLQTQLLKQKDYRKVTTGFPFGYPQAGPNEADPSETITVWTKPGARGVELYSWQRNQPVSSAKKQENEEEHADEGHSAGDYFKAGGLVLASLGLAVATGAEDVATGGGGVVDDPASGAAITAMLRSAYALAA